jgi:hypothetical protein
MKIVGTAEDSSAPHRRNSRVALDFGCVAPTGSVACNSTHQLLCLRRRFSAFVYCFFPSAGVFLDGENGWLRFAFGGGWKVSGNLSRAWEGGWNGMGSGMGWDGMIWKEKERET